MIAAELPTTPTESRPSTARGEEVIAFVLLALAVVMFMAWPARRSSASPRSGRGRDPEGPEHPYRKGAPRERPAKVWVYKLPKR